MIRIYVEAEYYNSLINGETVKILVESLGERAIECSLTHGVIEEDSRSLIELVENNEKRIDVLEKELFKLKEKINGKN